jgi:hypothetical protein
LGFFVELIFSMDFMMIKNDTENGNITPADGNVVIDFDYAQDESTKILAVVDSQIAEMLAEIEKTSS